VKQKPRHQPRHQQKNMLRLLSRQAVAVGQRCNA
jgi:hypothetical protein